MGFGDFVGGLIGDIGGSLLGSVINRHEADTNRRWQSDMSSTAYQRAAKDLEKAGLNRILALGSPASTPSGSTATAQDMSGIGTQAISTAMQARNVRTQVEKAQAEKDKVEAEKGVIDVERTIAEDAKKLYESSPSAKRWVQGAMLANISGANEDIGALFGAIDKTLDPNDSWSAKSQEINRKTLESLKRDASRRKEQDKKDTRYYDSKGRYKPGSLLKSGNILKDMGW